ncbi:MAG TPA: NAD(P)-dependent oxidoreductase [Candidatus Polarisedimenticolaceae bacterium]|nr:NAD(P)-dependent oxidoreductase [Candidatus Polarisedimenticolaceae bacterium]
MSRSAVVFGGSGFIGGHLLDSLAARGYARLLSVDIRPPVRRNPAVEYLRCDLRQPIGDRVAGSFDEAYNLAAIHTTPGHPDHEYYDANVLGALHVVEFCRERRIERVCFTSSISVYGPGEDAKTEESPLAPVSAYGKSKLMAERVHRLWAVAEPGRRLVIARLAVIFGPGEGGNFTRLAKALASGFFLYPGRRDTIKGCAHVDEVVRSFEFGLARSEPVYLYNGCYPRPYTLQEVCDAFHEVGGLPRPRGTIPFWTMTAAVVPFEALNAIGLRNPICRARVDKLVHSTHISPRRLMQDGFVFETDLTEGLRRWKRARPDGAFV